MKAIIWNSLVGFALLAAACAGDAFAGDDEYPFELVEVAQSDRQWTGVAVSKEGRIFVNYPRWGGRDAILRGGDRQRRRGTPVSQ